MPRVIHLLPYDGIGGAEAAARSMGDAPVEGFEFELRYLFPRKAPGRQRGATFNPFAFLSAVVRLMGDKPDLLVLSLWRSCVGGILVKLMRPRTRLVVMVHNSVDAHLADRLATRAAIALADAVWSDSEASLQLRFRRPLRTPVTVIPFLARQLSPARDEGDRTPPAPDFIFWGRLAAQKNLSHALQLFRRIHDAHPTARYTVIGPDSGELPALRNWCEREHLLDAVRFTGPMTPGEIRDAARGQSFYLQTSDYEGMAMSVVEAMQLGLVPVVTPVGEIGRYCRDGENAIVVHAGGDAVADVLALLADPPAWFRVRESALGTWKGHPLYREGFTDACRSLLAPAATN